METQIFRPLHMYNTKIFSFTDSAGIQKKAKGYEARGWCSGFNYQDGVIGDKGVYSTVEDMFIWDQYLYTNDFIKQSEIQQAFVPSGKWKGMNNYGFGWRLLKILKINSLPITPAGGMASAVILSACPKKKEPSSFSTIPCA